MLYLIKNTRANENKMAGTKIGETRYLLANYLPKQQFVAITANFKQGQASLTDEGRSGRSRIAVVLDKVATVENLVRGEGRRFE